MSTSLIELRTRTGTGVALGRTCGASNQVSPSCVSSSAPDQSFHFIAPNDGRYTITTQGASTGFNTVLQVAAFQTGAILGCSGNASAPEAGASVTVNLTKNQEALITVDGLGTACGRFQLNIQPDYSPCGVCNSPPSNCYEPAGICSGTFCQYTPKLSGSACNDGNACTVGDTCNGSGACTGSPMTCTNGGVCSGGSCGCAWPREMCNGYCTDTRNDDSNCGGCGIQCGSSAVCMGSYCQPMCGDVLCLN